VSPTTHTQPKSPGFTKHVSQTTRENHLLRTSSVGHVSRTTRPTQPPTSQVSSACHRRHATIRFTHPAIGHGS